jgi:hypothetical protein
MLGTKFQSTDEALWVWSATDGVQSYYMLCSPSHFFCVAIGQGCDVVSD